MEYKEIYDELNTVLWGDAIVKTEEKGIVGVNSGYLIDLRDPFHNSPGKIDKVKQDRVFRLFKKFADKLYLETKDEYVIKLLDTVCLFVGEFNNLVDMNEITGTDDDPEYMFDEYKKEDAIEPVIESKYKLITKLWCEGKILKEETVTYKFYEEAKAEFDEMVKNVKEDINCYINDIDDPKEIERARHCIAIDDKDHFKLDDGAEYILEKV